MGSIYSFVNPELLKYCDSTTVDFDVNFDQELRFLSNAFPTWFFVKILILESVLAFETLKACKWLNSKIGDFCVELTKSQSFQAKLVLLGFS